MAGEAQVMWPTEEIPDSAHVFMRVHKQFVIAGELQGGVFRDHGEGMSVDWDKYSTAIQTRERGNDPALNGVIRLSVQRVRELPQVVAHQPRDDNRAHSAVIGEKKRNPEVRVKLTRLAEWAIRLSND